MFESHDRCLKTGRFYRLKKALGPIPVGVYRLEEIDEFSWGLSVGKSRSIRFFIMFGDASLLSPVTQSEGRKLRMSEADFAHHYYHELTRAGRNERSTMAAKEGSSPITGCMMPLKYERRYQHLMTEALNRTAGYISLAEMSTSNLDA